MRSFQLLIFVLLGCSATKAHAFLWLSLKSMQLGQTDPLVPNLFPFTALSALGFTQADQLLFMLCPLVAVLGSMVRLALRALGWSEKRIRSSVSMPEANHLQRRLSRTIVMIVATLFTAFVAGLVVALYFAGSIVPSREAVGKLLAFTLLIGYVAPSFFTVQEQKIARLLNDQKG